MDTLTFYSLITASLAGGTSLFWLFYALKKGGFKRLAADILQRAEHDAAEILREAELKLGQKEMQLQQKADKAWQKEKERLLKEEERIQRREDKVDQRWTTMTEKLTEIEREQALLQQRTATLDTREKALNEQEKALHVELEKVSGFTTKEARESLVDSIRKSVQEDAARWTQRIRRESEENAEKDAQRIICSAINRLAVSCTSKTTICTLPLPNEEMKGRIIGREGRNIRTLERATGVTIVIDDSPSTVVISGFDPIRKHVAKESLSELVNDGRIHPTRIEEVVAKVQDDVQVQIREYGENASIRVGAHDLHPELIQLIGTMQFRQSYGQNLLEHSLEVSHLLGIMAAELGLDQRLAKRIGLLHDIGKTVSHEVEGSHALIGYDLAKKYGESEEVANGIGCHHNEITPRTVEGSLCGAADALSAARPGARGGEATESYIKRLRRLEELAMDFSGIEQAYVLQAGRELRVVVQPDIIDDIGTVNLARDIAKRIENSLHYPGKIKVTILREKRVVEYAV